MNLGACLKCAQPRPMANLIVTASGITVCPECRYARDAYAITHQVLAPAPVDGPAPRELGLHVVDLPRSTKLPASTRVRRRRSA